MTTVENLIFDFHNLQGYSVQEKYKNFQIFRQSIQQKLQNKDNENKLIAKLTPRNQLEHSFRIDLLLQMKRNEELLEILKSGNMDHIGRVLKNFQFCAEFIPKFKPEALINDLFPQTSYVTKIKLVNRIYKTVKNEQLVDEYFEAIEIKYGLPMAFALLPGCSIKVIRIKVEKYKPSLSSRHIIEIYKKDSSFPLFYFTILKQQNTTINIYEQHPSVIKYIARRDINLFWRLQNKFKFDFKIGKHLTKKLILQNEEVIKNGKNCIKWFQSKKLYNTINQQGKMQDFLVSFYEDTPVDFVETHTVMYSNIYVILKFLTPEKRYDLLQDIFNKKYSKNLLNYQMKFSQEFLELMPVFIRAPIAKKHLEKSDKYTYLLNISEAISSIKEMLQNCSTSQQRTEKLELLCKTLEMNRRDKDKITEVFKFVFERYRNDTRSLKAFVYRFSDSDKNLEILDGEQLKLLNQMGVYTITECSNQYNINKISLVYLQWLIKNNRSFDDHLMEHLKRCWKDYCSPIFHKQFENVHIALEKVIDMLDHFKNNTQMYNQLSEELLRFIYSYNTKHKKNVIPLTRYKNILKHVLDLNEYYLTRDYFRYAIKKYNDKELHEYFWKYYNASYVWDMLVWFFKNDIKQIEENIELILTTGRFSRSENNLYKAIRMYATDSLKKKILEFIENKISFNNTTMSIFLINVLSYMDSEEFLRITAPFMPPSDGKFEENAADKQEVHKAVIRCLCNIESENLLQIVKRVCVGDYLKFGLQPLYKMSYRMKEVDIPSLLDDLHKSPVSIKKHSLLLSVYLLPTKEASKFIQKALVEERNISLKNVIFKKSLNLFIHTQTEVAWKVVHTYFGIINSDNTAMHDLVIKYIKKIPLVYVNDYIQSSYEMIMRSTSKEKVKNVISLAKSIPKSVFNTMSCKFLEEIIEVIVKVIFDNEEYEDCFWNYILYTNLNRSTKLLSCAIEIMKTIISDTNPGYAKLRIPLDTFTTSFCKKIIKAKNVEHKQLVEMFDLQWNFFPKHCLLDTALFLKITLAYYEAEFDFNKFSLLLNKLLHKYINEYDSDIISEFCNQLNVLCDCANIKNDKLHMLAELLLQCDNDKYVYILIIHLLPKDMFPMEDNKCYKWVGIVKAIEDFSKRGKDGVSVMFHYDKYLRNQRNEYIWIGDQQFPSVTTTRL